MCERFSVWMENDFQGLFGEANTTKVHRIVSHLQDEFLLRGSVQDGNAGFNEAFQKFVKRAFHLTNRTRPDAALQMVLAERISSLITPLEAEQKAQRHDGNRRRRVRARGGRVTVGAYGDERDLSNIHEVL